MTLLRAGDGWSYDITDDDMLWLARMAHWEGGDSPADTIWTMAQAYTQPVKRRAYATFGLFLQGYSQPINPKWTRVGEFCRPGGRYHDRVGPPPLPDECAEVRLARRDRARTMPWSDIDADVRAAVEAFAAGRLPNPVPRAVEFADARVSQGYLNRNPDARLLKQAGNWFIATRASLAWPDNWVTVGGTGSGGSWLSGVIAVGGAIGAAALVWYVGRMR
jgi:hypothetical protein